MQEQQHGSGAISATHRCEFAIPSGGTATDRNDADGRSSRPPRPRATGRGHILASAPWAGSRPGRRPGQRPPHRTVRAVMAPGRQPEERPVSIEPRGHGRGDIGVAVVLQQSSGTTKTTRRRSLEVHRDASDAVAAPLEFLTVIARVLQQLDLLWLDANELNAEIAQAQERLFQIVHALVGHARGR